MRPIDLSNSTHTHIYTHTYTHPHPPTQTTLPPNTHTHTHSFLRTEEPAEGSPPEVITDMSQIHSVGTLAQVILKNRQTDTGGCFKALYGLLPGSDLVPGFFNQSTTNTPPPHPPLRGRCKTPFPWAWAGRWCSSRTAASGSTGPWAWAPPCASR